jgi:hypothetical protein
LLVLLSSEHKRLVHGHKVDFDISAAFNRFPKLAKEVLSTLVAAKSKLASHQGMGGAKPLEKGASIDSLQRTF